MKLSIGENIRKFRKNNDLTQETLAEQLGVTYQSISRWENGTTYPDIELLPAIAETLKITVDELLGMTQMEKEKRACNAFDKLRCECMKRDYNADRIIELLRDIRRNYLDSDLAWSPWVEGNDRAFRNPKILPEVRLLAEAYFARHPMDPHVIQTMAVIEDEEHLEDFLKKYTTPFDCSTRALLFDRYFLRRDVERFEPERRYQLYHIFGRVLCPRYLLKCGEVTENHDEADEFMAEMLSLIRRDAADDRPDIWVTSRIEFGLKGAKRLIGVGKVDEAITQIESVVRLLEETMRIKDEVILPTSCRFLNGMEWRAKEDWHTRDNSPDSLEERMIYIFTKMSGLITCDCVYPSDCFDTLQGKNFDPLRNHPEFVNLCKRVKALIISRSKSKDK